MGQTAVAALNTKDEKMKMNFFFFEFFWCFYSSTGYRSADIRRIWSEIGKFEGFN